jgi:hypothetical protein
MICFPFLKNVVLNFMIKILLAFLLLSFSLPAFAQEDWEYGRGYPNPYAHDYSQKRKSILDEDEGYARLDTVS